MYQGFVLTTDKQLDALKKYCKKVYIDLDKGPDLPDRSQLLAGDPGGPPKPAPPLGPSVLTTIKQKVRATLLVAVGDLLLAGCYPPFDLPALSFIAVAPAIVLLRAAIQAGDPARALRWGLAYGGAANGLLFYWIAVALWHFTPLSALGYLVTVAVLTAYTGGLFWLVTRAATRGGIPLWASFLLAWTALEWWVGHQGDIAFPWLGLGTSLADAPLLVQWADIAGARGATLWVAWVNVMLVEAALDWGRWKGDGGRAARGQATGSMVRVTDGLLT